MKKVAITLILLISISFSGFSQMILKPAIGMNFTSLSNDPLSYDATGRVGWQVGGTVAFGEEFYFESGIFWVKNNWELQDLDPTIPSFKNDLSSIRIPIYIGWNIVGGATDDRNFHIFGGPAAQIITKVNPGTGFTKEDFSDYIWGMNVGAGLAISKIFIETGYEWGLTKLYKNDEKDVKSRGWWLNVGVRLQFL